MSFTRFRERSRDVQDGVERHVWGKQKYTGKGSIIKVRGTDTEDQEAAVLVIGGVSFNVKEKFNTEVMLLSSSSDTTLKMALLTIPKDKQRRWMEGDGGVQHPTDGDFALDFSDKLAHLTKNKFGVGEEGEFEVRGKESYFRVKKLIVDGELIVNTRVKTPEVVSGSEQPPKFEGNKQAEIEKDDEGGGGAVGAQLSMDF
ncbi:hypothetical protein [Bradyrhizobium sp. USDA 4508]